MPETCAAALLDPRPGKPDGSRCREWDGRDPGWAVAGPLCETEVRTAERDTRSLLFDYLDLEQMIPRSLSQSLDGQPAGKPGPPVPLALGPEALQAEIVHVVTTWEVEVREVCGLSKVPVRGPAAPWHTTVTNLSPLARRRAGVAVQRAVATLAPRMGALSRIGPVCLYRSGVDADAEDVAGWEAVLHLSALHDRARAMLGRTRREFWVPGECWQEDCAAAHRKAVADGWGSGRWLYRAEPAHFEDEPQVHCRYCAEPRTYGEYLAYVELMVWPSERRVPVAA